MAGARWHEAARRSGVLAVAVVGLASGTAGAEPPAPGDPAWLSAYRAVAPCPDARKFGDWVNARRERIDGSTPTIRVAVSLSRDAQKAGFVGTIEITDAASATSRSVEGRACGEVAQALSLIAAIGLDSAESVSDSTVTSGPSGANPSPAGVDVAASGGAALEEDAAADDAAPPTRPRALRPDPGSSDVEIGALVLAIEHGAASPERAFGAGFAATVEWRAGAWQPALLLGAYRVVGGESAIAGADVRARFELVAARAQGCPLRFPRQGRWALRPCLELELGEMSGTSTGTAVVGATTKSGVWMSSGFGLRGDAAVWGPLRLSLQGSALVPFTRHEFSFSPNATLAFRVPAFSWQAAGSVGVAF
jgi:hypothetical protein